jgi:hypothetical protein
LRSAFVRFAAPVHQGRHHEPVEGDRPVAERRDDAGLEPVGGAEPPGHGGAVVALVGDRVEAEAGGGLVGRNDRQVRAALGGDLTVTGVSARKSLADQYNNLLNQITQLATDASYNS